MIDINIWMDKFLNKLDSTFGNRIWFVGLQGSYARGEATEKSDIDVVVIFDELTEENLKAYRNMIENMSERELICGFVSGKGDLLNWEPSDLFQFYYDTVPYKGSLDDMICIIDDNAVNKAIKTGICNIYHGCVHNMIHEKSYEILKSLYKSASFTVQAICFKQTGKYIKTQKELFDYVDISEQNIIKTYMLMKNGGNIDFDKMSAELFLWAKKWIGSI